MNSNRRSFLQKILMGASIPAFLSDNSSSSDSEIEIDLTLKGEDFWEEIRRNFPLSDHRVYLNNGTFGPSPTPVTQQLKEYIDQVNTSGEYGHTDQAREKIAEFVGAKSSEISLTHNTTEGINIVTWGLPLKEGDEVIISLHEHVGNAMPWLNRAKLDGLILKPFEPGQTEQENIDRLEALITPKTRVIALPHITCTTGLVFPIKEIARLARKHRIFTAIDGAHGAGTFNLDVHDLGIDFYASCCHKWMLGPLGTGFLYVKEELLDTLQAIQVGAYSDTGWDLYSNPPKFNGYVATAHRFDYGTQSTPIYEGAAAAAKFHQTIGKRKIEARIRQLNQHLFEGLKAMEPALAVLTPEEPQSRICMVTFKPKNWAYQEFARTVSKEGFRIRVVPESKLNAIRISTHIYNSKTEIDRFLEVVSKTV